MILRRFEDRRIAQNAYMVGCPGTREAIVVDPTRDLEPILAAAAEEGVRITHVTETHIHADYLSGAKELADRTGATLHLSDEGDADWKYAFGSDANVRLLRDGDVIQAGSATLTAMHTPGHTPEHLSFVLRDASLSETPIGAFTGDFLFVGDVGRPDLLERAAGMADTMAAGAETLFESIRRFVSEMPDATIVWPGHGSGSACGKSLGGVPVSTLGYEKATNWALKTESQEDFVAEVLDGQPEPPAYFAVMKSWNKLGPASLGAWATPLRWTPSRVLDAMDAQLLDVRPAGVFGAAAIPGALNVPLGKSLANWAGSLLEYERPIVLVAANATDADEAARALAIVGLDEVVGWVGPEIVLEAERRHGPLPQIETVLAKDVTGPVLDVRGRSEFAQGHAVGATHIPLGELSERTAELTSDPVVVHCGGGVRSAIAASILLRSGRCDVRNLVGGYPEIVATGLPTEASR